MVFQFVGVFGISEPILAVSNGDLERLTSISVRSFLDLGGARKK